MFVFGGQGGFEGADGVKPIEFLILVGDGNRQWLEPHYVNGSIKPIGNLQSIVPEGPAEPDALLDACIAFCPRYFEACPSLAEVASALQDAESLDFNALPQRIPTGWAKLREEARPVFADLNIWRAELVPLERSHS